MYTMDDLKETGVKEFRAEPTGDYTTNRNGKRVPVTKGVEYVTTKGAGRMPESKWHDLIRQAADKDLLEKIKEHCRSLAWLRTEKALEEYSLECLANGAYLHWPGFDA